jgi:hypothetical protein
LRLYRSTLAEIHTYQTDITTLTLQEVAVLAALSSGDTEAAANLATNLLAPKKPSDGDKKDDKEGDKKPKEVESNNQLLYELGQRLIKLAPGSSK